MCPRFKDNLPGLVICLSEKTSRDHPQDAHAAEQAAVPCSSWDGNQLVCWSQVLLAVSANQSRLMEWAREVVQRWRDWISIVPKVRQGTVSEGLYEHLPVYLLRQECHHGAGLFLCHRGICLPHGCLRWPAIQLQPHREVSWGIIRPVYFRLDGHWTIPQLGQECFFQTCSWTKHQKTCHVAGGRPHQSLLHGCVWPVPSERHHTVLLVGECKPHCPALWPEPLQQLKDYLQEGSLPLAGMNMYLSRSI